MLRQNETAEGILRAPAHGAEEAAGVQVERVDQHDEPVLRVDRRRGTEPEPGPWEAARGQIQPGCRRRHLVARSLSTSK